MSHGRQDSTGILPSPTEVHLGTSAANPFIIPAAPLEFKVTLRCIQSGDSSTLRAAFYAVLDKVFGRRGSHGFTNYDNPYFQILEKSPYSTINWDLPLQSSQRFEEGSNMTKLISMVTNDTSGLPGGPYSPKCRGAVIAKKGSATFALRKTEHEEESAADPEFLNDVANQKSREYKVILDHIPSEGLELWTAIRKWMPRSPWWFLSPSFMEQVASGEASLDNFYASTIYDGGTNFGPYIVNTENHVFQQQLSAFDFNVPDLEVRVESAYSNVGHPINSGSLEGAQHYTKTFVGYATNLPSISGPTPEGASSAFNYFITSPSPEQFYEQSGVIPEGRIFSLMSGEGGPGGDLPGDNFPGNHEHPPESDGVNPILKGLNFASSAFGFVSSYYPFTDFAPNGISITGPWFTGLIHSNSWIRDAGLISAFDQGLDVVLSVEEIFKMAAQTMGAATML